MPDLPDLMESLRSRRAVARWRRAAEAGAGAGVDRAVLARIAPRARTVADHARRVAEDAEARLTGSAIPDAPAQADWIWRPRPWAARLTPATLAGAGNGARLCEGATVFHDCPLAEITLSQRRATDADAAAPYALDLDVLGFGGSFLSLALDLPGPAAATLRRSHVVDARARIAVERGAAVFLRLNVGHGPNVESLVSALVPVEGRAGAAFDLGPCPIAGDRVDRAWLDLIVEAPAMTLIRIDDLVVHRRPRADV